eukprot:12906786-Prorocentrum_lima.AAC.1
MDRDFETQILETQEACARIAQSAEENGPEEYEDIESFHSQSGRLMEINSTTIITTISNNGGTTIQWDTLQ